LIATDEGIMVRFTWPQFGTDIYLISFLRFTDMKEQFVYDPLISKRQQYLLATQVCISIDFWVSLSLHYAS